ncbi:hypothetical protein [Methylophilus sp. DW102]|uniref:hypothetical protein n=1 Tax=Methylophilus sp. DW102 TaxID=3095607 RepID=UPI003092EB06|nr:HNH endonuclease [Methylophilus sp. DW102]
MKYIPLRESKKEELEAWLNKSNEILAEMKLETNPKKRRAIIHRNKSHWRNDDLLNYLKKLSDGKCWYTEARFVAEYPQLEHFRPKSCARDEDWKKCHDGYWWLAFDIENYRVSKPMPNVKKGTYFPLREPAMAVCDPDVAITRESPLFLDPVNQGDAELISFNALGQPEPCPEPAVDLCEWDKRRIEFSIKRYGLDNTELCDRRKELWVAIESMISEYATNAKRATHNDCKISKGKAEQLIIQLKKYLEPSQEFTSLISACFLSNKVGKALYPKLLTQLLAA